jgi:hypothetical protein
MDKDVEARDAGHKGKGLFALREFSEGDVILQWQPGRVIRNDDIPNLSAWEQDHLSELALNSSQVLPEPRCYANHACTPNAISTSDTLYALRDIGTGDEITIDYRLNALDHWEMPCKCDAYDRPHVVIGDFFTLPAAVQEQYMAYAPSFVREEYQRRHGST